MRRIGASGRCAFSGWRGRAAPLSESITTAMRSLSAPRNGLEQPFLPLVAIGATCAVVADDLALEGQDHRAGRVRHLLGAVVRRVAERDAARVEATDVHRLVGDAVAHDDPALVQQLQRGALDGEVPGEQGVAAAPLVPGGFVCPPVGQKDVNTERYYL